MLEEQGRVKLGLRAYKDSDKSKIFSRQALPSVVFSVSIVQSRMNRLTDSPISAVRDLTVTSRTALTRQLLVTPSYRNRGLSVSLIFKIQKKTAKELHPSVGQR